ncbi:hypothetical protein [Sphingomonas sp.]|jgi:hypothetical protein|uniref:hypothetical protein n=1 Tax=Sphingomonas sp. TaxID=28214 RepID=UPI002E36ED69|nr:hypothetical protein [Sphingomonas sp.]HEX4695616.1 hypothetical protein [Sphingomonas sp.]
MFGEHFDDFHALVTFIVDGADDRTSAILHVSYIEKYLSRAIGYAMPGLTTKLREKLFGPDGALGPLAAKNDIARALNIIAETDHHNLKLLASIRNKFAHNIRISSFDDPEISKRAMQLRCADPRIDGKIAPVTLKTDPDWQMRTWEELNAKQRFEHVAASFNMGLHNYVNRRVNPQPKSSPGK